MVYKRLCVIGGGKKFAGYATKDKIVVACKTDDCFRVKEIGSRLDGAKLNKSKKIYGDICLPVCNYFVMCQNGINIIEKGEE